MYAFSGLLNLYYQVLYTFPLFTPSELLISKLIIFLDQATAVLTVIVSGLADLYFRFDLKKLLMVLLPVHAIAIVVLGVAILTADRNVNNEGSSF